MKDINSVATELQRRLLDAGFIIQRYDATTAISKNKNNFVYQMFLYELVNHEYNYTKCLDDTLRAVNITYEQLETNAVLKEGLKKAILEINKEEF